MQIGDGNKIKNSVIGNHNKGDHPTSAEPKLDKLLITVIGGVIVAVIKMFLDLN
ncbi:hypothetical protein JZO66_10865 [Enterococcus sp. DIV0242_7C1]|uniref:Uncharacterized protein n=1 Tax=Candidatus Enterococcus dunnyi TaxID=1834192 RepID=A0A200JC41_9ENTE|nr:MULTISPECIES: hypothetical protein [unclassified Enterococcus]MBO0471046.1 hypothetical protein [Enterococcus sp. DIV0242_7C1]MCA5011569.1 hypothetical protein [Enterococcus sp. S23]MCA5014989.1 hypothetical protein [Enterococcus sp. S22(2020)]OUZ34783.1 hypothetical protein A5889_000258 [Enterococcus sp. 9D6_DIV0238]